MDHTPPQQAPIARVHDLAIQIYKIAATLRAFTIRFEEMGPDEQTRIVPTDVRIDFLEPLGVRVSEFAALADADLDGVRLKYATAAHVLKLDLSRRRFRNIENSSVHLLAFDMGAFFVFLWDRAFSLEKGDPVPACLLPAGDAFDRLRKLIPGFSDCFKVADPDRVGLRRFMLESHTCLSDFNPTPFLADLDREILLAAESTTHHPQSEASPPPPITNSLMDRSKLLIEAMRQYHDAASSCLFNLVCFQEFLRNYQGIPQDERKPILAEQLFLDYISPIFEGLKKVGGNVPRIGDVHERMTAARIALGRSHLTFGNLDESNAHTLILGVSIENIRMWNLSVRPGPEDQPIRDAPFDFKLFAPPRAWETSKYMADSHSCLFDKDFLNLHVELDLELAKAIALAEAEPKPVPKWDPERRELSFEGQVCKKFRQRAQNQVKVLTAFEEDGWPPRIDDPFSCGPEDDPRQRLADTVRALNARNELVFFGLDGTERILWKPKIP